MLQRQMAKLADEDKTCKRTILIERTESVKAEDLSDPDDIINVYHIF